ncbi:MAG: hypothetical protein J3R72DRAFT_453657 [Linnemannia gamsii]|nr:MAG: hypothetical protein J3R72DRAFT_453657 [Linnemannia gamsii]
MRFSNVITPLLILLILAFSNTTTTFISAQQFYVLSPHCNTCAIQVARRVSNVCDPMTTTTALYINPMFMFPQQRQCACHLASNSQWLNPCVQAGRCSAYEVNMFYRRAANFRFAACVGIGVPQFISTFFKA